MNRSKRMLSIAKIASKEEESAAQGLADALNNFDKQNEALSELMDFKLDYSKKFYATTNTNAMMIQQFHNFVAQLNQGIEHQQKVIAQATVSIKEQRELWAVRHNRTRALNKVVENFVKQENELDEKMEQKLLDEYAMRIGRKNQL